MSKISEEHTRYPSGLLLWGFRAPVWLYRAGLGWLFGKRMIYLEHTGRKSGKVRRTVVEVVRYDREREAYYVVSGYGEKADWFRNVMKTPLVEARVGGRQFAAQGRRLSFEDALAEFRAYFKHNPMAAKMLGGLIGLPLTGADEELVELSKLLPVLEFRPAVTGDKD